MSTEVTIARGTISDCMVTRVTLNALLRAVPREVACRNRNGIMV